MFGKKKSRFGFGLHLGPLRVGSVKKSWAELHAFFDRVIQGEGGKTTVTAQLKEYRSWVSIATSVIYRRVGSVDYKFFRSDTEEEIKRNNRVYKIISKIFVDPNPYMEYRFIKQYLQLQLDLTGAAFLLREDDVFGKPLYLWPLPTNTLSKIEKGATFKDWIKGFTFKIGDKYVTYKADNVLYFHYPDPEDPRDFCSPIKSQAYAIDIDHYIEVYERDFFKNSARPDFTISYPENVEFEEEDARRVIEMWKKKFQGEGHYHEVALLDRGAIVEGISPKNEDLALMSLAGWSQEKVLAAYNVPPGKVGIVKDVNKANAAGIDITFNSECIKPRLDLQDEVLTRGVLQKFDSRIEIMHNNPIPRDQEQDIKEHREKVGVPTMTINEARARDGQKSVSGGDIIMIPLNYMALGSTILPSEEPPEEPEEEPEEGKEDIVIRDFEYSKEWLDAKWYAFKAYTEGWESVWRTRLKALFEDQQEEVLENLEAYWDEMKSVFDSEEKIKDNFRSKWPGFLEAHREKSIKELTKYFNDNTEIVEKLIIGKDDGLAKVAIQGVLKKQDTEQIMEDLSSYIQTKQDEAVDYILFDWKENKKAFDKTGKQITGTLIVETANEELTALGLEASFGLENKLARQYLGTKVAEFSTEVLSTKSDQLKRALTEGFKKGEDIRRLSERVRGVYDGVITGKYEAIRIARTETISAANAGSMMGYKDSGVVKEKGWLSTRDQRTRGASAKDSADHLSMDGQRKKLDDAFVDPRSGARMKHPGDTSLGASGKDVVFCRCFIDRQIPIFTANGNKEIGDIKEGDLVLTHKGQFRPVTKIYPRDLYKGEVIKIWVDKSNSGGGRLSDPNSITVTPEHPLLINEGWKEAKDLIEGEELFILAHRCPECGSLIPWYRKYCSLSCNSKTITRKQWADPKHRKNISQKASAQMHREYENGTRDKNKIVKKAREAVFKKYNGSPFKIFWKEGIKAIIKKYGSQQNLLNQVVFPKLLKKGRIGNTAIELNMKKELEREKRSFKHQFYTAGRFVDFYLSEEKLFIECDGLYWHQDKEFERRRDKEILLENPDHSILHIVYGEENEEISRSERTLYSLNHEGVMDEFLKLRICKIERYQLKRHHKLYNFAVEEDESYIAKGFPVHNCTVVPYVTETLKPEEEWKEAEEIALRDYELTPVQIGQYKKIMRLDSKEAIGVLAARGLTKEKFLSKMGKTRLDVKNLGVTKEKYFNKKTGKWTEKREKLHEDLANKLVGKVPVSKKPTILMTGGYPGSGKSTILDEIFPKWKAKYVHVDSDQIKASLALHGDKIEHLGWRASAYHWEADSVIDLVFEKALKQRKNILFDGTMKSKEKIVEMVRNFKKRGYDVEIAFADLPMEKTITRAIDRFLGPRGRFVDPAYIITHGRKNLATLEAVKDKVAHWYHYNTDVAKGKKPKLIGKK